jgi:hypothetical protein
VITLPALPIATAANVSLGVVFALGTLPAAMLPLAPSRAARAKLLIVSVIFAVAYAAGVVVGEVPPLAVIALFLVAYGSVMAATQRPAAALLPALVAPGFALGMNEPLPDGLALAAIFLAGGAWATLVDVAWPLGKPSSSSGNAGRLTPAPQVARLYAVMFATAGAAGVAFGYALDYSHPAWAGAAAMFIMRPDADLLTSRAIGRACATVVGVLLAALLFRRGVSELPLAIIAVCAVTAAVAVRTSRWYVSSAGAGLVVVLMSGVSSTEDFLHAFGDRIVQTLVGAGMAVVLGVLVPKLIRAHAAEPRAERG